MKIIGLRKSDFTAKDGTEVKGFTIYGTETIPNDNGKGLMAEKYFLSENKIKGMNLDLNTIVGKNVVVSYNRFGKIDKVVVLN